jgi:hypothetical protein
MVFIFTHHPHCTFRNMAWKISNLRALSEWRGTSHFYRQVTWPMP